MNLMDLSSNEIIEKEREFIRRLGLNRITNSIAAWYRNSRFSGLMGKLHFLKKRSNFLPFISLTIIVLSVFVTIQLIAKPKQIIKTSAASCSTYDADPGYCQSVIGCTPHTYSCYDISGEDACINRNQGANGCNWIPTTKSCNGLSEAVCLSYSRPTCIDDACCITNYTYPDPYTRRFSSCTGNYVVSSQCVGSYSTCTGTVCCSAGGQLPDNQCADRDYSFCLESGCNWNCAVPTPPPCCYNNDPSSSCSSYKDDYLMCTLSAPILGCTWRCAVPPYCTVALDPTYPSPLETGTSHSLDALVSLYAGATVKSVNFSSSNTNYLSLNPISDISAPYQTTAKIGNISTDHENVTVTANVTLNNSSQTCSNSQTIGIIPFTCCTGDGVASQPCRSSDHQNYSTCVNAGCTWQCAIPTPAPCIGTGSACSSSTQCCTHTCLDGFCSNAGKCIALSGDCAVNLDCCSNYCLNKKCQCGPNGNSCSYNSQCCSNYCLNQKCANIPTPTPSPSCTLSLSPSSVSLRNNYSQTMTANVNLAGGAKVSKVNFISSNTSYLTVGTASDISYPYQTIVKAKNISKPITVYITATAYLSGTTKTCSSTSSINLIK